MGTNENVYFTFFKFLKYFFLFFCSFKAVYIIHIRRKIFQALRKCIEMLVGQYGRRYQHCRLLIICNCLKSRPHGYFRLAKTYVTTHQPIHRRWRLHISFYIGCRLTLVRRIFIKERRFQLRLHIAVRREGKAF